MAGDAASALQSADGVVLTRAFAQRFFGRDVPLATAQRMGYPHTQFLDDPSWVFTDAKSQFPAVMPNAFRPDRTEIGLVLYDGVREVELSSVTDAYPRSTASDVLSLAPERSFVKTAHGMDLLPRFDLASAPALNRVLVPGTPDTTVAESADRWAAARGLTAERIHASGAYAYDLTLRDLARHETRPVAIWAAAWLEYPTGDLALERFLDLCPEARLAFSLTDHSFERRVPPGLARGWYDVEVAV